MKRSFCSQRTQLALSQKDIAHGAYQDTNATIKLEYDQNLVKIGIIDASRGRCCVAGKVGGFRVGREVSRELSHTATPSLA